MKRSIKQRLEQRKRRIERRLEHLPTHGQGTIDHELVDVRIAIEKAWEPFHGRAGERQVMVTCDAETEMLLKTDASLLYLLFTNLLDNAITYVDDGGWISVNAAVASDSLWIEIANTGCRLGPEQQSRVFERFWRADVARADTGTHAGLGLALTQANSDWEFVLY